MHTTQDPNMWEVTHRIQLTCIRKICLIYSKGFEDKIPQNKEKAVQLFTMAADQGDVDENWNTLHKEYNDEIDDKDVEYEALLKRFSTQ